MPNLALTWYESKTTNVGFEASVLSGLINVEFDYFVRKRSGLLTKRQLTLPTTFGQELPVENLNSDRNQGFEIVLGHRHKIGDFTYDVKETSLLPVSTMSMLNVQLQPICTMTGETTTMIVIKISSGVKSASDSSKATKKSSIHRSRITTVTNH